MKQIALNRLVTEVRQCTACHLVHGANPVLQMHASATILIAGQAPGAKVHATGVPFDDPSGSRLRSWMGLTTDEFYDERLVAIVPMAFCYPGKGKSGDLPPPPLCAERWREKLLAQLTSIKLTVVIGQYAKAWHLPESKLNITDSAKAWASFPDSTIVIPHPSPRNNIWLKKNPWYETEVVPELQSRVDLALGR
ncbi:MAG: uracil-DNA glycosylase [Candidatus Azotimanducaceae bacterium]